MRIKIRLSPTLACVSLALLFALTLPPAYAWNDQVTQACTHEGQAATEADLAICHAYIEGFLDGAVITDAAIIDSVKEGSGTDSRYLKRAYMTRAGGYSAKLPSTALAQFCLPSGLERKQIVADIADAIAKDDDAAADVSVSLYKILQANYPCES